MSEDDDHVIHVFGGPGRTMDFLIERTPEKLIEEPELTFSANALDGYFQAIADWVIGQMVERWRATERPVHRMRLTVSVALDDELDVEPRGTGKTHRPGAS
jgi:hypothetical protein